MDCAPLNAGGLLEADGVPALGSPEPIPHARHTISKAVNGLSCNGRKFAERTLARDFGPRDQPEMMRWIPASHRFLRDRRGTFDTVGWGHPPHQFNWLVNIVQSR